jgi:hypothetical protein
MDAQTFNLNAEQFDELEVLIRRFGDTANVAIKAAADERRAILINAITQTLPAGSGLTEFALGAQGHTITCAVTPSLEPATIIRVE